LIYLLLEDLTEVIERALHLEVEVAADNLFRVLILIFDNARHLILNIINKIIS